MGPLLVQQQRVELGFNRHSRHAQRVAAVGHRCNRWRGRVLEAGFGGLQKQQGTPRAQTFPATSCIADSGVAQHQHCPTQQAVRMSTARFSTHRCSPPSATAGCSGGSRRDPAAMCGEPARHIATKNRAAQRTLCCATPGPCTPHSSKADALLYPAAGDERYTAAARPATARKSSHTQCLLGLLPQ